MTDILIVGGGLSGLALAATLQRIGADYQLLDARDRLGGRILSVELGQAVFDLGPTWFWPGQSRLLALVRQLDLPVFEQFAAGLTLAEDRAGEIYRDVGLGSMQGSYRIDGGLGQLIRALAQEIPADRVRLNCKVVALTSTASALSNTSGPDNANAFATDVVLDVEEHGERRSVRANRVVMALPPRIVDATITFTPQLPAAVRRTLSAIPTWMAGQAKILAVYDRPYWREAGWSGDAMSQRGPMVEIHDASPQANGPFALFGFVGVPATARHGRTKELLQLAREQLVRLFGSAMQHPQHIVLQDWSHDVLTATPPDFESRGEHPANGKPSVLKDVWSGHLFFAGSELAEESAGLLEGALASAEEVAREL